LLRELGRVERPENAHILLLECGYWSYAINPYPARLRLPVTAPTAKLPELPDEPRLDLTGLAAYAIDDWGNQDPDDAISLETFNLDAQGHFSGGRIWVHVADAAALVPPESPADLEARARGATMYLPEGPVTMLPPEAVKALGLGLAEVSPALSFGLEVNAFGEVQDVQIQPSWVRVQRLSYEQVDERLDETPFSELFRLTQAYQARRQANGAQFIDLPEIMIHVVDQQVSIRPVLRMRSRNLVREAMLMAGEASAHFAIQNNLPFPYATQDGLDPANQPDEKVMPGPGPDNLALFFALRKMLRRGQVSSLPGLHAGVGLPAYSRTTSPLRRYLDLVVHQKLRLYLRGGRLLDAGEILERVGASESITGSVNQAESLSRRHWTLVYLMQHPGWEGEGVLVEKKGLRGRIIVPELALESNLHLREDMPLNSRIMLAVRDINLPELDVFFAPVG
jgi:exoribonuclease II